MHALHYTTYLCLNLVQYTNNVKGCSLGKGCMLRAEINIDIFSN
jgi:hypothetical protein